MAQKYTILKVIIPNSSKSNQNSKGFTLLELMAGLSIMIIVGGLAMNALVQASINFNKDKKGIDSSQSASAILEIIGNDIKQSGENINDKNFPTIEFKIVDTSDTIDKDGNPLPVDIRPKVDSSKIIVRRALTEPLTLCETIRSASDPDPITGSTTDPTTKTSIVVADSELSENCDVGTSSSKLVAARPLVEYELTATTDPVPTTSLATLDLILPRALRKVRDYRCQLDDLNPTVKYDDPSRATDTFCGSPTPALEKLKIAVSNDSGQFLIFNQTGETLGGTGFTNTAISKKYSITVNTTDLDANAVDTNDKNKAVAYPIKSPIYVIEERIYTLSKLGYLQLSINGGVPQTLTKKIDNFRVSAKTYTNSIDRIVEPTPAADICTDAAPFAAQPTTGSESSPKYICKLNYFTGVATGDKADWKRLAGIKVEIQTQYDGTGQNATATAADTNKLYAVSEFFPRNVLSK